MRIPCPCNPRLKQIDLRVPFWLEPFSFLGSSYLMTFIDDSLTLTMSASRPYSGRSSQSCVLSHDFTCSCLAAFGTLSPELRTPQLPATHVRGGYVRRNGRFSS